MTKEKLQEIKEKAQKATPGPWISGMSAKGMSVWQFEGRTVTEWICSWQGISPQREYNMDYISAVDPTTILALIGRIEALEKSNG